MLYCLAKVPTLIQVLILIYIVFVLSTIASCYALSKAIHELNVEIENID